MARTFKDIFPTPKPIIGMIHLAGADIPGYDERVKRALEELRIYAGEGVAGAIIEDYHARPAAVKRTLDAVADCNDSFRSKLVIGVNVLSSYRLAFAWAKEYSLPFVQMDQVAGTYLDKRNGRPFSLDAASYAATRALSPETIVLGGVHPKYYIPSPGSDLDADLRAGMTRAEAIAVTGRGTGQETPMWKILAFRNGIGEHPLIVAAGVTPENACEQLSVADGAIVGSAFKPYKDTSERIEPALVRGFMASVQKIRDHAR